MENYKRSFVKYSGRSIPTVIFNNCNELEILLKDWLGDKCSVGESVGLLMYKLGIVSDGSEIANLYNFNKEENSFDCIINDRDIYNIKLKNLSLAGFNPEIILSKENEKHSFVCIPMERIELGMRVLKTSHSVYENEIYYTRYMSTENALFTIEKKDYILEFGVTKPSDVILRLFDSNGRYSKYTLDNEEKLVKYLIGLEFPMSIIDIYKNICDLFLGDINKYPRLLLKVSKIDDFGSKKTTDLIHLNNGELENFGMTILNTNRTLFLDKDGSWSCEILDSNSLVDFSMKVNEEKINYSIGIKNDNILEDTRTIIEDNIRYAHSDIEKIKVLTKKIFNR